MPTVPLVETTPAPTTFGALPRAPRPVLLVIVYGLFLVVVGVTAMAQTVLVSLSFSDTAMSQVIGSDAGTVRSFVNLNLIEADLSPDAPTDRRAALATGLASLIRNGNLLHVEVRLPDGTIIASEDPTLVGRRAEVTPDFAIATGGSIAPGVVQDGAPTEAAIPLQPPALIREYLPVSADATVRAVVGVWRDATPSSAPSTTSGARS